VLQGAVMDYRPPAELPGSTRRVGMVEPAEPGADSRVPYTYSYRTIWPGRLGKGDAARRGASCDVGREWGQNPAVAAPLTPRGQPRPNTWPGGACVCGSTAAGHVRRPARWTLPCTTSRLGMQVGTQWCFLGQLINYDSMPL
jgi:hypothetical protein